MPYTRSYYPSTGTRVRRRTKRKKSALGDLSLFGQARSLKANFESIKGVLITGTIAAVGAITTERVFGMLSGKLNLTGYKVPAAKMGIGLALGLVIAKVAKKPKIAAAFALGPVISALIDIVNMLTTKQPPAMSGLGVITSQVPVPYDPSSMYAGMPQLPQSGLGEVAVGPQMPAWMNQPQAAAYPFPSS